jgi:hypothetical protein
MQQAQRVLDLVLVLEVAKHILVCIAQTLQNLVQRLAITTGILQTPHLVQLTICFGVAEQIV